MPIRPDPDPQTERKVTDYLAGFVWRGGKVLSLKQTVYVQSVHNTQGANIVGYTQHKPAIPKMGSTVQIRPVLYASDSHCCSVINK